MDIKYIDNWYVLCVAVFYEGTVEQVFEKYSTGKSLKKLTDEDIKDIKKLKKTCTFKEISEIYYLSASDICHRLRRYKENQLKVGGVDNERINQRCN